MFIFTRVKISIAMATEQIIAFAAKKTECHSEMVWYFIGVYMIKNRLLLYYMAA